MLSFALTSTMIPCGTANLVPFNAVKPVVTPAVPVTNSSIDSKNSSNDFSIQSIKSKISDILNPKKDKTKLQEIYSGSCGDNLTWKLDTSSGVLTISGTGDMFNFDPHSNPPFDAPWMNYKDLVTSVKIENGVINIGDYAFYGCNALASVTIPDSVTSIRRNAFNGCAALSSVTIPNPVTSIGENAFYGCSTLTSATLGNSLATIGVGAFACSGLTSVTIPSSVTSIGKWAFMCTPLKSISIPNSVTSIEVETFKDCSALTSVTISDSVTFIGDGAFWDCSALTSITIPDSVTSIGEQVFDSCTALTSVNFGKSVTSIGDGAFFSCSNLEHIILNNNYQTPRFSSIFDHDFNNLKEIKLADGITSIQNNSFAGCNLSNTKLILPSSIDTIESDAFKDCVGLNSIVLNNDYCVNNFKTFFNGLNVHTVEFGDSITSIGSNAFNDCTSLTEINLPTSISEIGTGAFHGCSNLEHITLNSQGALSSFSSSFNSCKDNAEIEIKDVESIPAESFQGCAWLNASIIIPTTATNIGANAFNGCSNLTEINLPSSISEIGSGAFHGCSNLGHITLSSQGALSSFSSSFNSCKDNAKIEIKDVESIPAESFKECGWLNASIIIPNTVTNIGANAFNGCSNLTEINLPSNVSNIENGAFYGCSNLGHITLSSEGALSSFRSSFDSCKDNAEIEIKDVESIPAETFKGCSWLKEVSIIIPNTVTNIGDNAFEGCSGLTALKIPASVVNIGNCAFDNCTNLSKIDVDSNNKIYKSLDEILFSKDGSKLIRCPEGKKDSVKLPNNVDSISSYAFSGCKKLSSVTMNENLKTISEYAFKDCTGLTSINIPGSVTEIEDGVFSGCTNIISATLNNSGVLEKFKSIFSNCSNLNTVIIGNGVDTIPDDTFNGCNNLNSVSIGNDVTSIGDSAFNGCSNLSSISIGDNVVLIGDSAFSGCVKLSAVTIPNKVSMIYRSAFSNCKKLTNVNIHGNLNYVGQEAFGDCTELNNFTYQGTRAPLYDDPGKNVFSNCPHLDKVNVPKNYEGKTFCGHKTTKGMSVKEWFEENIAWWLSTACAVAGFVLGGTWRVILDKIKNCYGRCRSCCHHDRDALSATLIDTDQNEFST